MAQKDPWMLDPDEHKKIVEENKGGSTGVICPKRNISIGGKCEACNMVQKLFADGSKESRELAFLKMAKSNYYANVVFPENPNKSFILEMGKKAGNTILDNVFSGKWKDIAHPMKGKGRELEILKKKGDAGFNTYEVSPNLEKADWDIPQETIESQPNLDNIIELLATGSHEIFKASTLKMDETLKFRVLPPWDNGAGNKRVITVVWRHWGGVTQEEVDGTVEMDLSTSGIERDTTPVDKSHSSLIDLPKEEMTVESTGKEACFGNTNCFETDDEDCLVCKNFKECKREVKAKMKG